MADYRFLTTWLLDSPREPVFDVVVFDEASQCRLEEALPHLKMEAQLVVDVRRDVRSPEAQIAAPAGLLAHVRRPTARLGAQR